MKYIYLDMNKWVLFAKGWQSGKGEIYDLVKILKEKIKAKEISIVVSMINIHEIMKNKNETQRVGLFDFVLEMTPEHAISPFLGWVTDLEVMNLFAKRMDGKKPFDIQSRVIDKWMSIITGAVPSIKGDIPEKEKEKMLGKINSPEVLRKIFTSLDFAERAKKTSDDLAKEVENFEEARAKESYLKDSSIQYKLKMGRFLQCFVFPRMATLGVKYNLPKDFIFKEGMGEKEMYSIFQELPATYSYFALNERRDRELHRKIKPNDLNDLMSFTMGVAYCDILFGEKMFVHLAKQSKLDELYGTLITSSLEEFKKAIS